MGVFRSAVFWGAVGVLGGCGPEPVTQTATTVGSTGDGGVSGTWMRTTGEPPPPPPPDPPSRQTEPLPPPCEAGDDEVGWMHVNTPADWTFEGEEGVIDADCEALDHTIGRLRLWCYRTDEEDGPRYELRIHGEGPVESAALEALEEMEPLAMSIHYAFGFFGHSILTWSLRGQEGELLLLGAVRYRLEEDTAATDVGIDGWAAPFEGIVLADPGCPVELPNDGRRLAVEVPTDDGVLTLIEGRSVTVGVDGVRYVVNVPTAQYTANPPPDGSNVDASFIIVREL